MARTIRLLGVTLLAAAHTLAQTCADKNPEQAAALIDRVHLSCEKGEYPTTTDIYDLAGVAGEAGIPALRRFAAWPTDKGPWVVCQSWVNAARISLAKLGDESYRPKLHLADESLIGDDRALLALIEFLVAHAHDPAMLQDFGDYDVDQRDAILGEIDTIRRRRRVPNLPLADYSDAGIAQWKSYLEKHKGRQLTFAVYLTVTDPYLQCLARRVDFGYADAILAIAAKGGDAARSILRQFPKPWEPEPMGFAVTTVFQEHWRDIQGNVQAAVAQLGDEEVFQQIVDELQQGFYAPVRKLEFIGGKRSVEALVKALDVSEEAAQKAQAKACGNWTFCYPNVQEQFKSIWLKTPYPPNVEMNRETCATEIQFSCLCGWGAGFNGEKSAGTAGSRAHAGKHTQMERMVGPK
jgi:hypothetical protein